MADRRLHWEKRYSSADRRIGTPSPFLTGMLPRLPKSGTALDLACGDGRHALALAQHGLEVTAIDFARAGLDKLRRQALQNRLAIDIVQANLESYPLPEEHFDVAIKTFYLQRNLIPKMRTALRPGGIAIVETFLIDQRQIGHPRNPAFLLDRGELKAAFAGFDILEYREGLASTGTNEAYLARFAAVKPNGKTLTRH